MQAEVRSPTHEGGQTTRAEASVAWAITTYLIEREKQQAQVEIARLELQAKNSISSQPV